MILRLNASLHHYLLFCFVFSEGHNGHFIYLDYYSCKSPPLLFFFHFNTHNLLGFHFKTLNIDENNIGDSDADSENDDDDDEFTPFSSGRSHASKQMGRKCEDQRRRRQTVSTKNKIIEDEGKYENRAHIRSRDEDVYTMSIGNLDGVDRTGSTKIKLVSSSVV